MALFSILFSYSDCGVLYNKSAIVRASSRDAAEDKLVSRLLAINSKPYPFFRIERVCLSSYNYVFE